VAGIVNPTQSLTQQDHNHVTL